MADGRSRVNWDGLKAGMAAGGLDVVLGASIENFFYIADTYLMSHIMLPGRLGFVVVPRQGEPAALVCWCEELQARQESWIQDMRTYVEFEETAMHALAEMLKAGGLARARIGVEARFLAAAYMGELTALLPAATILPADDIFQKARAIKAPAEVEILTRAAQATEKAIVAAFAKARPGDTERVVADEIAVGLIRAGGTSPWVVCGSGDRSAINHPYAGSKPLTPGEILRVDVGAVFAGYQSDVARTAAIGAPTDEQLSIYRRLRAAQRAAVSAIRPGAQARDVYWAGRRALEASGFEVGIKAIGHSLGTGLHDFPMLTAEETAQLRPGMLLAVEPAARDARGWIYHVEDTFLVTEENARSLTSAAGGDSLGVIA